MKHSLDNVTICAIDCANPKLAIDAINKSIQECDFKEAIIFTDAKEGAEKIKLIEIEKINNKDDYSNFILKELHNHIQTPYVLVVQWDGYVIDGRQWNSKFLDYDYIGAKWHWHKDGMNIGNGGFSIRSKKLLEIISRNEFPFISNMNEDDQICRFYRSKLEKEFEKKIEDHVKPDHKTWTPYKKFISDLKKTKMKKENPQIVDKLTRQLNKDLEKAQKEEQKRLLKEIKKLSKELGMKKEYVYTLKL
jgi:hypothetical protein